MRNISIAEIRIWLDNLSCKDSSLHRAAISKLWSLSPSNSDAVSLLVDYMRTVRPRYRGLMSRFIGLIGPAAAIAIPDLMSLLRAESEDRHAVLISIGDIGVSELPIADELSVWLLSDDPSDRVHAAYALLRLEPQRIERLQVLRAARLDPNFVVRSWAAEHAVKLIAFHDEAMDIAFEFLDDPDEETVECTSRGLAKYEPAIIIPKLLQKLPNTAGEKRFGILFAPVSYTHLRAHET